MEIERKWIFPIKNICLKDIEQQAHSKNTILQGYLDMQYVCFDGNKLRMHDTNIELTGEIKSRLQSHDFLSSEIRYRIYDGNKAVMTVKSSGGLIRREDEFPISLPIASSLSKYALGEIQKTRFKFYDTQTKLWKEVDIYASKMHFDFGVIEIEFPSTEKALNYNLETEGIPIYEVTEISEFKNKNLALYPKQAQEVFNNLFPCICGKYKTPFIKEQNLKQI